MSFANLKRNSKKNIENLSKALIENKGKKDYSDSRYWEFKTDESGNGFAVIRFLPSPENEDFPFVKRYSHFFKDPKTDQWYIELSRTTVGEPDPVSEANAELWKTRIESNKEIARKRKRKLKYISNILVISDPKNPENEGKLFLWEYGPRIFQKIELAINPPAIEGDDDPDNKPIDPFDFWKGANFRLKARQVDGQRSYDLSKFDKPSALFNGEDEALEELWKKQYSLKAEVAPEKFKSYEELKKRFDRVTGRDQIQKIEDEYSEMTKEKPHSDNKPKPKIEDDDDDDLSEYSKLLED